MRVQTVRVGDPAQAAGCDASETVGDAVAIAEFLGAVFEEADQGPTDVAEAEEAEVVGVNSGSPRPDVRGAATEGETPSGQPAGRRRYVAC